MLRKYEGPLPNPKADDENPLLRHICEVCGKEELLTANEAYAQGWDYPPKMAHYGVLSPRTCGSCPITGTAWWAVVCEGKDLESLSISQKKTVRRIVDEPQSIMPEGLSIN